MENYKLIDNAALHQYEFRIGDLIPRIEYIKTKNGEIYLTHTEVPSALEGKGVGSSLVRLALEDIERQQLRNGNASSWKESTSHKTPDYERHDRVFER